MMLDDHHKDSNSPVATATVGSDHMIFMDVQAVSSNVEEHVRRSRTTGCCVCPVKTHGFRLISFIKFWCFCYVILTKCFWDACLDGIRFSHKLVLLVNNTFTA